MAYAHGRSINIATLTSVLKLRIEDYTDNVELKSAIRQYNDLLIDCAQSRGLDHIFQAAPFTKPIDKQDA